MLSIEHIIAIAAEYGRAENVEEKTVSSRVFQDSKKLAAIRNGSDITVGRFNAAMSWFSDNWPVGAIWPNDVPRPVPSERIPEAAE